MNRRNIMFLGSLFLGILIVGMLYVDLFQTTVEGYDCADSELVCSDNSTPTLNDNGIMICTDGKEATCPVVDEVK